MLKAAVTFAALMGSGMSLRKWAEEIDIVDYASVDIAGAFEGWKLEYGIEYSSVSEEFERFRVWSNNLRRIAKYNSEDHGSARVRMNQFGGMTDEEFKRNMFGEDGACYKQTKGLPRIGGHRLRRHKDEHSDVSLPSSVDWTQAGCVTPVKNQGQCGSCWAFSTTGSIECREAIKNSYDSSSKKCSSYGTTLSEQQLVDCSSKNHGCNGGQMSSAMSYVSSEGGLCSESEYPYEAKNGQCKAGSCGEKYGKIKSHTEVQKDSESAMMAAVAKGCVSVAIEADQFAFQYYSSGVLDGTCGTNLDHGVLITGYGEYSTGEDYWEVKNSWGASWGINGYVLVCRDCGKNHGEGECGILEDGCFPVA